MNWVIDRLSDTKMPTNDDLRKGIGSGRKAPGQILNIVVNVTTVKGISIAYRGGGTVQGGAFGACRYRVEDDAL